MDTTTLIWIIVGIAILLVIVVVALVLTARARRTRHLSRQHERAEKLRASARETELSAREHEAEAARARADAAASAAAAEAAKARAAEASIEAERRASIIDEHSNEAQNLRERQAETLRKADDVDPYVDDTGRTADATEPRATVRGDAGDTDREIDRSGTAGSANVVRPADGTPPVDPTTRRDVPPAGTERT